MATTELLQHLPFVRCRRGSCTNRSSVYTGALGNNGLPDLVVALCMFMYNQIRLTGLKHHLRSQYQSIVKYTIMKHRVIVSPSPSDSLTSFTASVAPKSFPVVVHPFLFPTTHSCAYERGNPESTNAFVFIGGLTSGPHTANELVSCLLTALDEAELGFAVWEFRMRSSYTGWTHSTVDNDALDIHSFVTYLRKLGKRKIVLMGSSTGKLRSSLPTPAPFDVKVRLPGLHAIHGRRSEYLCVHSARSYLRPSDSNHVDDAGGIRMLAQVHKGPGLWRQHKRHHAKRTPTGHDYLAGVGSPLVLDDRKRVRPKLTRDRIQTDSYQ